MEITTIVWTFVIGAIAAMCICYYNARFLGALVRKLLEIDATSPEAAISLDELGIELNPALKQSLRPGTSFSETVLKTEDDRYYIAPERVGMAKSKYRGKDTTIVFLILCIIGILAVGWALSYVLPGLIENTTGVFGETFGNGGNTR